MLTDVADQQAYLADLAGACRYARANRLILVWRMLSAIGGLRRMTAAQTAHLDLLHNSVWPTQLADRKVFLHRKGAAPAHPGQPTVVLGSRGAPSWVMLDQGTPATLWSVAHGAGRKMGRSEAVAKLSATLRRADLTRTDTGRVLCDDARLLYAEHPAAYKPIAPIIDSLEAAGAATRVIAITPRITVKRRETDNAR
ncbi:MAG: release factor H-coupled RctB family protein [Bradymonadia bacterium]